MAGLSTCTCISAENIVSAPCSFSHKFDGGLCQEGFHTHSHEKSISQKALDAPLSDNDELVVEALGIAFSGALHVDTSYITSFGSNLTVDQNVIHSQKEVSFVLNSDVDKGSRSYNSISLSEKSHLPPLSSYERNKELSSNKPRDEVSGSVHSPTQPDSMKLISAMRGGREKHGLPQNMKLRVTWAPDVYDPPVTPSSHTPRGSRHRSNVKKKDSHKHKNNKSKHSRGNSSKHASRRSTYNTVDSWTLSYEVGELRLHNHEQSDVEILKHGVVNCEISCGNSYYRDLLASMRLRTTKAS